MDRNKVIAKTIISTILFILASICMIFFAFENTLWITIVLSFLIILVYTTSIIALYRQNASLIKIALILLGSTVVILAAYLALQYTGMLAYLSDSENMKNLIGKSSPWGEIIFILISFAQVTFVPIPSTITIVAGTLVFGVWRSTLYSLIGIMTGSMFAFFLGRTFGMKIVKWTVGEGMYRKYQNLVKGKDKIMLFLMFIFPMFPDDLLCIVAGLTDMSYLSFLIMMIVTRPIGILTVSGSSELMSLIPLSGWGLAVWGVILAFILIAVVLLMKYSNFIQDKLVSIFDLRFNKARKIKGDDLYRINPKVYGLIRNTNVVTKGDYNLRFSESVDQTNNKRNTVQYRSSP